MNNFSDEIRLIRRLTNNPHLTICDLPPHSYTYTEDGWTRIASPVTDYWVNLAMILSDKKSFKKMFKDKVKELTEELVELRKNYIISRELCGNKDECLLVDTIKEDNEKVLLAKIEEFEVLLQVVTEKKGKLLNNRLTMKERIERAKSIPIQTVLAKLGITLVRGFVKCPLHDEGTPSCKIYTSQNSYFSYCCNLGGDNISFVQASTGKGFKDTLDFLLNDNG